MSWVGTGGEDRQTLCALVQAKGESHSRQLEPQDTQQPALGEGACGEQPRAGAQPWQVHREGPGLVRDQSTIAEIELINSRGASE